MIFLKIRMLIAAEYERATPLSGGEVEVNETTSAHAGHLESGGGAGAKTCLFGLLKRAGFASLRECCRIAERPILQAIILGRVSPDSVIHWDGWRGYDGLVSVGYPKHYRVDYGPNVGRVPRHLNGIERFRSFAEYRLHLHPKMAER